MTNMPHVAANAAGNGVVTEELVRIVEAYLRDCGEPVDGQVLSGALCNQAIDWWNALPGEAPSVDG